MPCEVVIKLKNHEKSCTYKYLEYDLVTSDDNDHVINRCLAASFKNFGDEVEKETINIKLIRS